MNPPPSILDRLAPRTRIVAALGFCAVTISLSSATGLTAAGLLSLGLAMLGGGLDRATGRKVMAMDLFVALAVALLPLTVPGQPILPALPASQEGLAQAAIILARTHAAGLTLMILIGRLDLPRLGHGLKGLGLPPRLVLLLVMTARYVDVLAAEYARLRLALTARGFVARADRHTWRTLGTLFGMLLVNSMDRAERISQAMRLRGFDGTFHSLDVHGGGGHADWGFGLAKLAVLAALLVLENGAKLV